jgi:hypothetical protein
MDKGQNYSDGVWNKVHQLQPVVVQQAAEEISRREVEAVLERPVRLAYQPPASSTFLSEQTSHQQ